MRSGARLLRDTRGANYVEYIIIIGVVAIAALSAFRAFGRVLAGVAHREADALVTGVGGSGPGGGSCVGGLCLNGACFVAGTPVATPDGLRPIEQIAAGDRVLSRSEETGAIVVESVVRTFVTEDEPLVEVRAGSDSIRATPGHRFWTADRGWVEADELEPGEALLAADGGDLRVGSVKSVADHATVYNLEVEGTHTYFVGRDEAWVHNPTTAGGCGGSGGGGASGGPAGTSPTGGASSGGSFNFVTGSGQVLTGTLAQQAATLRAGVQAQVPGLPRRDVVVAGVMDTTTGQIYYGTNSNAVPSPLNPLLAPYVAAMQQDPQHFSTPGAHAEVYALNDALNARAQATGRPVTEADLGTFMVDTAWLRGNNPGGMNRGDPAPLCGNCQGILPGVINLPGNAPPRPDPPSP